MDYFRAIPRACRGRKVPSQTRKGAQTTLGFSSPPGLERGASGLLQDFPVTDSYERVEKNLNSGKSRADDRALHLVQSADFPSVGTLN